MDDSWRFRPPPPPPPAPFGDLHHPHPPFPPAPYHNPAFRAPDTWTAIPHPPLERPPFFHPPHPPPMFLDDEREAYRKRMRVDDSSHQFNPFVNSASSEDERRLSLIRDHGHQGFLPFDRSFTASGHGFPERNRPPLPIDYAFPPGISNSQRFGGFAPHEGERRDPYSRDGQFEDYLPPNQIYRQGIPVGVSGNYEARPFEQQFHNSLLQDQRQLHLNENSYISPNQAQYPQTNGYQAEFGAVNAEKESSIPESGSQHSGQSKLEYHCQQADMINNHYDYKHSDLDNVQRQHQYQSYAGSKSINGESGFIRPPGTRENGYMGATLGNHVHIPQNCAPLPPPLLAVHHEPSPSFQGTPSLAPSPVPSSLMGSTVTNVPLPSAARTFPETHPWSHATAFETKVPSSLNACLLL